MYEIGNTTAITACKILKRKRDYRLVEPNLFNIAHFITGRVGSAELTKSEHAHPVAAVEVNA